LQWCFATCSSGARFASICTQAAGLCLGRVAVTRAPDRMDRAYDLIYASRATIADTECPMHSPRLSLPGGCRPEARRVTSVLSIALSRSRSPCAQRAPSERLSHQIVKDLSSVAPLHGGRAVSGPRSCRYSSGFDSPSFRLYRLVGHTHESLLVEGNVGFSPR
jgi:hypothetical protein